MDARIANAKKIIEKKYGDHLSVGQLARKQGLSRSQFAQLFKQETGQDCRSCLLEMRMTNAKDLLTDSRLITRLLR